MDENEKFGIKKDEIQSELIKTDEPTKNSDENAFEDNEDNYKSEGTVILHITRFTDFARGEGPGQNQRLSEPIFVRGLPWKILAIPREMPNRQMIGVRNGGSPCKGLGFFLQCNGDSKDLTWNCTATATLKMKSPKDDKDDFVRKISHQFHSKENDWGFSQFMTCDQILDPITGFVDENDTVTLTADVNADAPHGVQWDSKKHTGYIGLKNQGATCYMNSILQTLFFTNRLRKAVYQMPTEDDDPENSVALAMQRVFYELQFSTAPVGTKKLTKSFGWDTVDSFLQHDVQELCRVLLDNLESKMKTAKVADTIPSLFKGRMKSYIKCKNIDFESSREESFYDVQLKVKGPTISKILDSFDDYVTVEELDGENKYDAGDHGLQPAQKGVKFLSFPPVLHLQLMRFQYDPQADANVKLNDRFEFSDELDLNKYIDEEGESDDYMFLLYAVLVHSGDFHGGHYVVYINTSLSANNTAPNQQKWCKFDDDVVSRAVHRDAVEANFGGDDPEIVSRSFSNAYMLVYVKKNSIDAALSPISEKDIPEHLKNRFEMEKKRDAQRKQEREEASHYCEITLVTEEDLKAHTGFELFDQNTLEVQCRKLKVEKAMTYHDLYKFIGSNMSLDPTEFRLWNFTDGRIMRRDYYSYIPDFPRPTSLIPYDPEFGHNIEDEDMNGISPPTDQVTSDHMVYMEVGKYNRDTNKRVLHKFDSSHEYLAFIKYYNHERRRTEFKGIMFFHQDRQLITYIPKLCPIVGIPTDTKLNLFLEQRPDSIVPLQRNLPTFIRDFKAFFDGCIIVAEQSDRVTEQNNTKQYFTELYNRIDVEAHVNVSGLQSKANTFVTPFKGEIGLDWKLNRVCNWIGTQIDYDPTSILLWKIHQHTEKPIIQMTDHTHFTVKELLNLCPPLFDPRTPRCYKLYYTKLPIRVADLDHRRHLSIQVLGDKFQVSEMNLFVEKNGTVGHVLEEAKKEFPYSENGTGQLRLIQVGTTPSVLRVFHVLSKDQSINEVQGASSPSFSFRVEEIPSDQLSVVQDERLLPVAHYDKEPTRTFGVPFFIKIRNEEPIAMVKQRIKEMLEVPDKDFEKYKFCIITNNRVVRELDNDENAVVHLSELNTNHYGMSMSAAPYLGIDHVNKSRGMRGSHTTEKAIVIHN